MIRLSLAAIALLLAAETPDAFVSPSASTFVHRRADPGISRQRENDGKNSCFSPAHASSKDGSVSMNLFDRASRVARGNLNNVLKTLETPEVVMNQAVEDMRVDLERVRRTYAEATASQRRLGREKNRANNEAKEWYERAQLALRNGREDLAREALGRRQRFLDAAAGVASQMDAQAENLDRLYEGMKTLEESIAEAKSRKAELAARTRKARMAATVTQQRDELGGLPQMTSLEAYNRMVEKVEALEAVAEASSEALINMKGTALLSSPKDLKMEREFAALEGSAAVDEELEKMKRLLGP